MLLLPVVSIIVGFVVLVWGADRFVEGSAATARNLGVSPLLIGLTIVGFGTSAPEMLVSGLAAFQDAEALSVGNAVGSSITNIALVLGVTALVAPLPVSPSAMTREIPLMLVIILLTGALFLDFHLSMLDGILLLTGMAGVLVWLVISGIRQHRTAQQAGEEVPPPDELPDEMSSKHAVFWLLVGLLALLASARAVVWGATEIASTLGVSDLVIGLSVVALGTSLPELAASVMGALKGEHDIAIGNVIGSNFFNLLGVLCLPGLIRPGDVDPMVLYRDYGVLLGVALLLWGLARLSGKVPFLTRPKGAVLLLVYVGWMVALFVVR